MTTKGVRLPFLPGNSFNPNLGRVKFHKSHLLEVYNYYGSIPMLADKPKTGIGGIPIPGQIVKNYPTVYPPSEAPELPTWVVFDKQILIFYAYFQETVHERRAEKFRVRKCKIMFFLEDSTIQVVEPKQDNSGVPQGTLIKRHRIPKPPPHDNEFYGVDDLNVSYDVEFYGKMFRIVSCDAFTRNFLSRMGILVPAPTPYPYDPHSEQLVKAKEAMQPRHPCHSKQTATKQYLEHDRQVLRFYGFWDDRRTKHGDVHQLVLLYYLADDTVEIKERHKPNDGRDKLPSFIKRGKLPKEVKGPPLPGTQTKYSLLNVLGPSLPRYYHLVDTMNAGDTKTEYYTDVDFTIGTPINAWGRKLVLCDCDDFTKEYYRNKFGIENFTPIKYDTEEKGEHKKEIPPYTGIGEDIYETFYNSKRLIPQRPHHDFTKFYEKDRFGVESHILRFKAELKSEDPLDAEKLFIISYHLCDDTIDVFQVARKDFPGWVPGSFIKRAKIVKPGYEALGSITMPNYYSATDLFIGAVLTFYKFNFAIIDADEYAVNYMEKHKNEFPVSNFCHTLDKIRPIIVPKYKDLMSFLLGLDTTHTGEITSQEFWDFIRKETGDVLVDHEILTLARQFEGKEEPKGLDCERIRSFVHTELRRYLFVHLDRLEYALRYRDMKRTGYLDKKVIRSTCKAAHLPLENDLLDAMLDCVEQMGTNEAGQLRYSDVIELLDAKKHPSSTQPPAFVLPEIKWMRQPPIEKVRKVNYEAFMEALVPEEEIIAQHQIA